MQLQLDQIVVKEESPYTLKETGRSGKSKSSKSKARRSPYPTVTAPEYTSEYAASASERPTPYDYSGSSEVALQHMQSSYPSIMYPHGTAGQEGMERYGAFYPSAYSHPGFYSDSTVGMYSSYHRYFNDTNAYASTRGSYEDRYYPKDTHSGTGTYPGYVTTSSQAAAIAAQESPRTGQSESRDSYRGTGTGSTGSATGGDTTGSTAGNSTTATGPTGNTQQYDCSIQNSQCSRSSSRDTNYNQTSHSKGPPVYPTPYSNRSESSASEVDVTEEYEKRHGHSLSHRNHHDRISATTVSSSYNDSLMEAVRVAEDKKYKENCRETSQTNSNPLTNGDSKDSVVTAAGHNNSNHQQQQQQSVIMRRQSNSTLTDLTSRTNDQTLLSSKLHTTTNALDDSRSKSLMDTTRMNSLASSYSHCNYDAYKQSSYHTSLQTSRTYPMMPQPGYTSVIVDATQQYHLANGYAH